MKMESKNHPIEKENHLNKTSILGFQTLLSRLFFFCVFVPVKSADTYVVTHENPCMVEGRPMPQRSPGRVGLTQQDVLEAI